MPLDTGDIAIFEAGHRTADGIVALRPTRAVLQSTGCVGAALRQARETLGLAEDDIALVTRVRASYVAAIEAFDLAALPARPFVVGYVRAYAHALGFDPEAVVARFRAQAPKVDGRLGAPVGLHLQRAGAFRWLVIAGAVVATAVGGWNISRHSSSNLRPPRLMAPRGLALMPRASGPVAVGAPLPTPPEATSPPVYQTPGLDAAADGAAQSARKTPTDALVAAAEAPGSSFVAAGAVYGARGAGSGVVLQARKPTSLVVRGSGGVVYFARQLAAGEAWRAPAMGGLTADVGAPGSMDVFVGGAPRGVLVRAETPLDRLGA